MPNEPTATSSTDRPLRRPTLGKMLRRGVLRRCAWCGDRRAFFDGWYGKRRSCVSCGLQWRRGDVGYELGAAAIAAIIVMGPLVFALAIVMLVTWPEIDPVPILIVLGVGALTLPFLLYPVSYTVWQAIDIMMRPPEPSDFDPVGDAEDGGRPPQSTRGSS